VILGVPPIGGGSDEMARYRAIMRSAMLKQQLQSAGVPDVTQVWSHEIGASRMLIAVAIKQRYPGHARQAGHIAAMCHAGAYLGRYVIVVDEDVDVTDLDDVMWAVCTRCDPAEDMDVIRKAWSRRSFSHQGRYQQFADVEVWPTPQQRPHPPVWIACSNTPRNFAWVGEQGYNLLTIGYVKPIAALAELTRVYRDASAAAGHAETATIATHYHTVVAEDRQEARRIAEEALKEHVRLNRASRSLAKFEQAPTAEPLSIEQLVDEGRLIAGDPDDCARMLRLVSEQTGCTETHCLFQFGTISFDVARRSMELFATHVMPRLTATAPSTAAAG